MKPAVIESIHEFNLCLPFQSVPTLIVRVWREQSEVRDDAEYPEEDLIEVAVKALDNFLSPSGRPKPGFIATELLECDRVNAVEVKWRNTLRGIVLYRDWP